MCTPCQVFQLERPKPLSSCQQARCRMSGNWCVGISVTFLPTDSLSTDPYELAPIVQGESYSAPEVADAARGCKCNTVIYRYMETLHARPEHTLIIGFCSLFMACTDCQNVTIQAWSIWSAACDALYVGQYPGNIPLGTAVPNWAYVNHTVRGRCRRWRAGPHILLS